MHVLDLDLVKQLKQAILEHKDRIGELQRDRDEVTKTLESLAQGTENMYGKYICMFFACCFEYIPFALLHWHYSCLCFLLAGILCMQYCFAFASLHASLN